MIVCNEEILVGFEDLLKEPAGKSVKVKFSGYIKDVCEKTFDIAENSYQHIVLTKIERQ